MSELAKAVCAVMATVQYVPETGENKFHKYKYASDEDLLKVIQPAMAANGLALIPHRIDARTVEHTPDSKGKAQWRTDLVVTYQLIHTSGEATEVQGPGCGVDGDDKGIYKAMTGALKYALRHLFLVPTGQDAERAEREETGKSAGSKVAEEKPAEAQPSEQVIDELTKDGWDPRERVVVEIRDFCRWLGLDADPWAAAPERQAKLPAFVKEKQAEVDAWIAWRGDLADLLRVNKLGANDLSTWLDANRKPQVHEMGREQREKTLIYLRDAGGCQQVRDFVTQQRKEAA